SVAGERIAEQLLDCAIGLEVGRGNWVVGSLRSDFVAATAPMAAQNLAGGARGLLCERQLPRQIIGGRVRANSRRNSVFRAAIECHRFFHRSFQASGCGASCPATATRPAAKKNPIFTSTGIPSQTGLPFLRSRT